MTFVFSKLGWMFSSPGNLLVLLLLGSSFLALSRRENWRQLGIKLCFDLAFVMFFIAIFPVGDWLLRPLENRFPPVEPQRVDGIIILGGDEDPVLTEARNQPNVHEAAADYLHFAQLARQYPNARLVFAGGNSRLVPGSIKTTPADVARQAFAAYGIASERLTFEDKSRTTYENAVNATAIVHPKPDEKWLLVTGAVHMPRSLACFRKLGWAIFPSPTSYWTTGSINSELHFDFSNHIGEMTAALHEYYGLVAYWLLGYISSPWPK